VDDIASIPAPSLDVRDLRVVVALAEAGTTAQAARLLHLTQPAVSRALLAAEDRAGARLFDRTPRGLLLTAAGERLVAGARLVLVELADLERRVRQPPPAPRRLRLVCECYAAYHWLPSTLMALREGLPDLELRLAVEHTGAPVAALEAGEIDVALLTSSAVPRGGPAWIDERPLFSDEVVFVVAPSHPLAGRRVLSRADLRAHPLLTSPVPPGDARWFVRRLFGRQPPHLRVEQIPLTEAILDLARAGMGIGVVSEWMASAHLGKGDLIAKRVARPLHRPWRLAWRREFSDGAQRLHAALQATVPRAIAT
jgi:LysR family transcriptional regulator for metE and metH